MRWFLLISLLVLSPSSGLEGWELFHKVSFAPEYFEEADAYFEVPTFDDGLKAIVGEEVTLTGYAIPFDSDTVFILSQNPFASCFFCGGAGPETVAEVSLKEPFKGLVIDDNVTVKGKLKLNSTDIYHLNFILEEATYEVNEQ